VSKGELSNDKVLSLFNIPS